MMSGASSQLINSKSTHIRYNNYPLLDGSNFKSSSKLRIGADTEIGQISGTRSHETGSPKESTSPKLIKQRTSKMHEEAAVHSKSSSSGGTSKPNNNSSKRTSPCLKTLKDDTIKQGGAINKGGIVSLFPKNNSLFPSQQLQATIQQQQPRQASMNQHEINTKQQASIIKQEDNTSTTTTTSETSEVQTNLISSQLAALMGDKPSTLAQQVDIIRSFVRTQALTQQLMPQQNNSVRKSTKVQQNSNSNFISQTFNHGSKFFQLNCELSSIQSYQATDQQNSRLNHKKGRKFGHHHQPQDQMNETSSNIIEWFQSLTNDDRVFCLTMIDDFFTESVIRMKTKTKKYGEGLFKYQEQVVQVPLPNTLILSKEQPNYMLKKKFAFQSIKALISKNKDDLALKSKQIPEKEFLDYVRITYTELSDNPKTAPGRYQASQKMNTITVSPILVQDPQKLIQLLKSIVGNDFLQTSLDISYDEHQESFTTKTPTWFQASEHNSLAYWIIFYLEISLQVHYQCYVRGNFRRGDSSLNRQLFIQKENQYINIRNEIKPQWLSLLLSKEVIKQISNEVFTRSLKINSSQGEISQLNGGLLSQAIYSEGRVQEVLMNHQEPAKFIQELCMLQLSRIEDLSHAFLMNQILVEVLREKQQKNLLATAMVLATQMINTNNNAKNKKKKDKKKMQKLKKQEQVALNANAVETSQIEEAQSEDNQEEIKTQTPSRPIQQQTDTEEEEEEGTSSNEDFCSNQQLIQMVTQNTMHKQQRNKGAIDEILTELLIFDDHPQPSDVSSNTVSALIPIDIPSEAKPVSENSVEQNCSVQLDSDDKLLNRETNQINNENQLSSTDEVIVQSDNSKTKQANSAKRPKRAKKVIAEPQQPNVEVRDQSPIIQPFQIIRSTKPNTDSPIQQQSKKNQNKKKKRSKAVEPPGSQTSAVQMNTQVPQTSKAKQGDLMASSIALNKFMQSIIKSDEEKDDSGHELKADSTYFPKQKDASSKNTNQFKRQYEDDKKYNRSTNNNAYNASAKSVYVKKGTQQPPIEEVKECNKVQVENSNYEPSQFEQYQNLEAYSLDNYQQAPNDHFSPERYDSIQQQNASQMVQQYQSIDQNLQSNDNRFKTTNSLKKKTQNSNQGYNNNGAKKRGQGSSSKYTATSKKMNSTNSNPIVQMTPQRPLTPVDLQAQAQYGSLNMQGQQMFQSPYMNMGGVQNIMGDPYNMNSLQYMQQMIEQIVFQQQQTINSQMQQDGIQDQDQEFNNGDQYDDQQEIVDHMQEQYYHLLDIQIGAMVKEIERKLESVHKERQSVIESLRNIVKGSYQKGYNSLSVNTRIYGSMASGLAIEQSDVDLAVVGLDFQGNRDLQINEMRRLCDDLKMIMKSSLHDLKFIDTATVPVIKLQVDLQQVSKTINKRSPFVGGQQQSVIDENMRYLGIDITFEDSSAKINHVFQCINYIQELYIHQPCLKPIVLILKKILQKYNLNQPYLGGLNSYSLVLMTSAFLSSLGCEQISKNLQEILNFYGNYFNPSITAIANQKFIDTQQLNEPMTVVDPHNPANNVTRSAFRIKEIQEIFKKSFQFLIDNGNAFKLNFDQMKTCDHYKDIISELTDDTL